MSTEVIGRAPRRIFRVAICTASECEEEGVPIEVPKDQLFFLCSCGQIVETMLFNKDAHERSAKELEQDRQAEYESNVFWTYAPQLASTKED